MFTSGLMNERVNASATGFVEFALVARVQRAGASTPVFGSLVSMRTSNPSFWDERAATHLVGRCAFGDTPGAPKRLASRPIEEVVDEMMSEAIAVSPPAAPAWVKEPWVNTERVYPDTTPEQRLENHRRTGQRQNTEREDLRCWWLNQMIQTQAPLREVMTLFWHGYFTTSDNKVTISQALYQQNVTLRAHALGRFRDLLKAISLDAAMMMYLDMEDSDRRQPNENFARELLELFTLGEGYYTERDVKDVARALTGWTLDAPEGTPPRPPAPPNTPRSFTRDGLIAKFLPERHDDGEKRILGRTGRFGLDDVVTILAEHPRTAEFVVERLMTFFGAVEPEGQTVLRDRLVERFRETSGSIAAVARELFIAPEFYAPASRANLVKSPVQLVVNTCRLLELDVNVTPPLARSLGLMGQDLFRPPNVKGWPGGTAWITSGTLAARYHLAETLLDGREPTGLKPLGRERFLPLPSNPTERRNLMAAMADFDERQQQDRTRGGIQVRVHVDRLFPRGVPESSQAVVDSLIDRLQVVAIRPGTRSSLIESASAVPPVDRPILVTRLLMNTPEFQLL